MNTKLSSKKLSIVDLHPTVFVTIPSPSKKKIKQQIN